MFEEIFSYPAVLRRHREGPLASERQDYLQHLKDRGAATGTVIRQARYLLIHRPGDAATRDTAPDLDPTDRGDDGDGGSFEARFAPSSYPTKRNNTADTPEKPRDVRK